MINGIITNSPVRSINAKVEVYKGSTLANTFTNRDNIISVRVERVGESGKFFGFGICQRINIHLRDTERAISVSTANNIKLYFGESEYYSAFPTFYVSECRRDETSGELSITGYDMLYKANAINMQKALDDLGFGYTYNLTEFIIAAADAINTKGIRVENVNDLAPFSLEYENGANFDGTEDARACLNAVAEITQTIYYINSRDEIVFKRIGEGVGGIEVAAADYFTLKSKTNRRLTTIVHATELGDNVSVTTGQSGTTQYIRDNPFWDLRTDIATLLANAIDAVGNLTVNQFELNWRGNYLLEIGDYIKYSNKKGEATTSYVIDDVIEYNGGFTQTTQWEFADNETETETNPATIGEALKDTYARVDKANKQITLLVSETQGNTEAINALTINTESINATATKITETADGLLSTNEELAKVKEIANSKISADEATLIFNTEITKGVGSVQTSTGFTFNEEGLTVSKNTSDLSTTITEDGMDIYYKNSEVLTANSKGVTAKDLRATTYLIVGTNSRFEDYKQSTTKRTGCFWIGG